MRLITALRFSRAWHFNQTAFGIYALRVKIWATAIAYGAMIRAADFF